MANWCNIYVWQSTTELPFISWNLKPGFEKTSPSLHALLQSLLARLEILVPHTMPRQEETSCAATVMIMKADRLLQIHAINDEQL